MTAFKVDENLPAEVAEILRQAGHDARSVLDQELSGAADADVAAVCRAEGRALLTLDVDFANGQAYPPRNFAGLILFRLARQDKARVLAVVHALLPHLAGAALKGQLWIVEETRIRQRE